MAAPIVKLNSIKFKGKNIIVDGDVDLQGTTATVQVYFDSSPGGNTLGPYPITLSNNKFKVEAQLGVGKWTARVVVTPSGETPVEIISTVKSVVRMEGRPVLPLQSGEVAPTIEFNNLNLDPLTSVSYSAALISGASGEKRLAAANHLSSVFGTNPRLSIYRNGQLMVRALFSTALTVVNDAGKISLVMGTLQSSSVLANGDLTVGNWTFSIQGGANYLREIRGTVGNTASSNHMKLSANPIVGAGFISEFIVELPSVIDGV